jgi:hypothetical protein
MAEDLARHAAELFTIEESPPRLLNRLTELVAEQVPGCSGATATLWDPGEVLATAATHPELAALAERQFAAGAGPILSTLRTREPSIVEDTVHEDQWRAFGVAALAAGVRSSLTVVHDFGANSVTVSLYGVRPGAFDPEKLPLASLLAAFGAAVMAGAQEYGGTRRTAVQLEEAIESRAVVDQAKGVLMQALGCDPDEAFDRLRQISQTEHVKLTEVAAKVLEAKPAGGSQRGARPA